MPALKINYCLICEGIRREPNNKANILGFFGVLPSVTISVRELGKPVSVLVFLVAMSGPGKEIMLKAEIINPDQSLLKASSDDDTPFPALKEDENGIAAFAFVGLAFDQTGKHTFQIFADGQQIYSETFQIREGAFPDAA